MPARCAGIHMDKVELSAGRKNSECNTAYLRIDASKPYHPTDEEGNDQRSQDQHRRIALARERQVLPGPVKLLAGLRQEGLQLLPAGFDLLLHAAEVLRPAAQPALQTKSQRVDLSFGLDAGFVRNASGGIEDESPFQTAPPIEQPFRLGLPDGRNLAHFFNHIGGGLNAVRKQSRFYGRDYALDLGVIDLELIEEFVELSLSRCGFQLLKLELSDLPQIFVGLFLVQQFIPLGAPSLAPRFAVVLLLKQSRRFFRPPIVGLDLLKYRFAGRRISLLQEQLHCRSSLHFADSASGQPR